MRALRSCRGYRKKIFYRRKIFLSRGMRCQYLRAALKQHAGEVTVVEFEMSFIVELEKSGAVRMILLEVEIVEFWFRSSVSTVLAYIHLEI